MMRRVVTIVVAIVLLLCACAAHAATETDRLLTLARVWSTVKNLDPLFVSSDVDWDAALIHAIPKVRGATTDDEFANAVGSMLSELHDPATRVERAKAKQKSTADVKLFRWDDRDVLVINAGPFIAANDVNDVYGLTQTVARELPKARAVVIDLRQPLDNEGAGAMTSTHRAATTRDSRTSSGRRSTAVPAATCRSALCS